MIEEQVESAPQAHAEHAGTDWIGTEAQAAALAQDMQSWLRSRTNALMRERRLTEEEWERILVALPGRLGARARNSNATRDFVETVLWVVDSDGIWFDIPPEYGYWRSVYIRFIRWCSDGTWQAVTEALGNQPELQRKLNLRVQQYLRRSWVRKARG